MTRFQTAALVLLAASCGWWAHSTRTVQADTTDLRFDFSHIDPSASLSMYNPSDQTIYVYQGATSGFSTLYCSYKFKVPHPGGPIERTNCPVGTFR